MCYPHCLMAVWYVLSVVVCWLCGCVLAVWWCVGCVVLFLLGDMFCVFWQAFIASSVLFTFLFLFYYVSIIDLCYYAIDMVSVKYVECKVCGDSVSCVYVCMKFLACGGIEEAYA